MCHIIYFLGKYTKKVKRDEGFDGFFRVFLLLLQMKTLCR